MATVRVVVTNIAFNSEEPLSRMPQSITKLEPNSKQECQDPLLLMVHAQLHGNLFILVTKAGSKFLLTWPDLTHFIKIKHTKLENTT
jgi:hypothetical protein